MTKNNTSYVVQITLLNSGSSKAFWLSSIIALISRPPSVIQYISLTELRMILTGKLHYLFSLLAIFKDINLRVNHKVKVVYYNLGSLFQIQDAIMA